MDGLTVIVTDLSKVKKHNSPFEEEFTPFLEALKIEDVFRNYIRVDDDGLFSANYDRGNGWQELKRHDLSFKEEPPISEEDARFMQAALKFNDEPSIANLLKYMGLSFFPQRKKRASELIAKEQDLERMRLEDFAGSVVRMGPALSETVMLIDSTVGAKYLAELDKSKVAHETYFFPPLFF